MAVVVVTDSSSRLEPDELQRWGIRQVPLHVLVDGTDLRDGIDPVPYDIHERAHVTTAGAAPADLTEAYRKALADSGGAGVVAVHLSRRCRAPSAPPWPPRAIRAAVRVVNARSAQRVSGSSPWRRPARRLG